MLAAGPDLLRGNGTQLDKSRILFDGFQAYTFNLNERLG